MIRETDQLLNIETRSSSLLTYLANRSGEWWSLIFRN